MQNIDIVVGTRYPRKACQIQRSLSATASIITKLKDNNVSTSNANKRSIESSIPEKPMLSPMVINLAESSSLGLVRFCRIGGSEQFRAGLLL
jgi:hypothetical protein